MGALPAVLRSGGRVVEGARLESEYTPKAYRGFESLPLRHIPNQARAGSPKKPGFSRPNANPSRPNAQLIPRVKRSSQPLDPARSETIFAVAGCETRSG